MLYLLLGIDKNQLMLCSKSEQNAYRRALWALVSVFFLILFSDAYFGYLFSGSALGSAAALIFGGFIHFSIYRLALITLTTRSLHEMEQNQASQKVNPIKSLLPSAPGLLRTLFISLIALAVSFPAATSLHHDKSEGIQNTIRQQLVSNSVKNNNALYCSDARFPFKVFEILIHDNSFKGAVIFFCIWSVLPLFMLTKIRNNTNFEYLPKIQKLQQELAERDFYEQLIESQNILKRRFNSAIDLKEKLIYENPPFNTRLKNPSKLIFFNSQAFNTYLNTLKK